MELQQLGQDLASGNLTAAQSDYSTVQQDLSGQVSGANSAHPHHHHQLRAGNSNSSQNPMSQLQLGRDLHSGNLSAARSAYSSLQQMVQPLRAPVDSSSSASTSMSTSNSSLDVSV